MTVTTEVLALADGMAQHGVTATSCATTARAARRADCAAQGGDPTNHEGATRRSRGGRRALAARCQLLPIVAAYNEAKRRRECLDFSDQMALAADLADQFPEVGAAERSTYRAVLLDEYQDTSHAQLVFLRGLFGAFHRGPRSRRCSPRSAIRRRRSTAGGARARARLAPSRSNSRTPTSRRPCCTLSTSFRNDRSVLAVANAIAEPLRDGPVSTPELVARAAAADGLVRAPCTRRWPTRPSRSVTRCWRSGTPTTRSGPPARRPQSIAVLVRAWRLLPLIEAALRERGVPDRDRRCRWPAARARGCRRGGHPAGDGRPRARRRADAAADRRALADRWRDLARSVGGRADSRHRARQTRDGRCAASTRRRD